ncbi:hypothetical protein AUJ68_07275 [Candidatus Woesearchaeota archaeon CG1_02_57_44]|nr:MAG: hypothetical protein AUJ68_07275 [Candidatus Woesearchaeota archaeon CG1_02_57_44]
MVIGLEIHAELKTKTKLFCRCPTGSATADGKGAVDGSESPNTRTCPICLGMPGSKPVLNKLALQHGLLLSLACNCEIAPTLVFSRKSYFYPDLAKNYQITQYELPLGSDGKVVVGGKPVGITRVHLEEDPASLVHPSGVGGSRFVLIDYNRSGNPLAEIVSAPDMASPAEARDFLNWLLTTLDYLGIFAKDAIIKADANVSIKESGYTRVEIKNITGFKEIERALAYEAERQRKDVDGVVQETRSWDALAGVTRSMRTKETEQDYGYIIDTDLVPIAITTEMIQQARELLPELADAKEQRYLALGVGETDARVISQDKELARVFELAAAKVEPVLVGKWVRRELARVANYNSLCVGDIDTTQFIALLELLSERKVTETTAQRLLEELGAGSFDVRGRVAADGLGVVADAGALEGMCKEAIAEAPQAVSEYRAGEEKALNFIIGIVMRKSKGKAEPKLVKEHLHALLSA